MRAMGPCIHAGFSPHPPSQRPVSPAFYFTRCVIRLHRSIARARPGAYPPRVLPAFLRRRPPASRPKGFVSVAGVVPFPVEWRPPTPGLALPGPRGKAGGRRLR